MQRTTTPGLLAALSLAACASEAPIETHEDDAEERSRGQDSDAGAPAEGPPLPWTRCARFTGGDEDEGAECLELQMPLRRSEDGEASSDHNELAFFVKRFPAQEEARAQLWMLSGGPGVSAASLEGFAHYTQEEHPDLEIYLPDHRGTGRSTPFTCEAACGRELAEGFDVTDYHRACADEVMAEWGEDLSPMSVTEAAYDVTETMAATARDDLPIIALGGSYGCYWLHRVLQVGGDLVDSAIFDSPLRVLGGLSDMDFMLEPQAAGNALLETCAVDEACSARLGDDPQSRALEILDGGGACTGLVEAGYDRMRAQYLVLRTLLDDRLRGLVPVLLHRLERCSERDVEFILALWDQLTSARGPEESSGVEFSAALVPLIHGSEVYTVPANPDALWDVGMATVFANLASTLSSFEGRALWPRYPMDRWVGQWAATDADILVLHGSFDGVTPIQDAQELAAHFSGPNQYYFEVQHAAHGVVFTSHRIENGKTCGAHILSQFLLDPKTRPEGDCANDPPPFEFSADDELLIDLLGHTNPWDDE